MSQQPPNPDWGAHQPVSPGAAAPISPRPASTPGKVQAPAIALLCLAAINGLFALDALKDLVLGDPDVEQILDDEDLPEGLRDLVEGINEGAAAQWVGMSIWLVASALIAVGGVMMLRMRRYPLALTGAILSMIPCVTVLGCCGVGQAVGIWATVILADPQVRGWFRQSPVATATVEGEHAARQ